MNQRMLPRVLIKKLQFAVKPASSKYALNSELSPWL